MEFTQTKQAVDSFAEIPVEKRTSKKVKTAIGICSIVLAIATVKWFVPPMSVWAVYALLVFGGFSIANDHVRKFAAFLPAVIGDIRAAWKGNS